MRQNVKEDKISPSPMRLMETLFSSTDAPCGAIEIFQDDYELHIVPYRQGLHLYSFLTITYRTGTFSIERRGPDIKRGAFRCFLEMWK